MTLVVSPSSCDCVCCCWALFLRTKLSSSCSYVLGVGSMVDEFSKMNPLPTRVLGGLSYVVFCCCCFMNWLCFPVGWLVDLHL